MQTRRRHRFLLLMLCAFIVSLLMNAGMAAGVRTHADAQPGGVVTLSLATDVSGAAATDACEGCPQAPAADASGDDVTFVDDEWMLPAFQIASFHYVPPAAPSHADGAELPVPVALLLRPPIFA